MASPKIRDFKLAVEEEIEETDDSIADFVAFTVNEKGPYNLYKPTAAQLMLLMAAQAENDDIESTAGLLTFMQGVFDAGSYRALRKRFNDRNDPLDLFKLMDIITELIKEWTGFPTQRSSDSPTSPPTTGKRSTGRSPGKGSTRSTSAPAVSAT